MKLRVYIAMAIGMIGTTSPACANDRVPNEGAKWQLYPGAKVVLVGDSNITNQDPTFYDCWREFKNTVDLFYSRKGLTAITWVNQGIGGAFTDTLQMDANVNAIIAQAPTHVINHIGVNDPRSIPEATSVMHYNTWFTKLYAGLPNVRVLMTTAPSTDEETAETMNSLAAAWRGVARDRGAVCVDLRSYFNTLTGDQQEAYTIDNVHISTAYGRSMWAAGVLFQTMLMETNS